MDPVSIIGLIASVASIADLVNKSIRKLIELKGRYRDAPIQVSTLIGQLNVIQAATVELDRYRSTILEHDPRYRHLARQLDSSLDCLLPLINSLAQYLDAIEISSAKRMTARRKMSHLWNERELDGYLGLIDRQVNALNLFLNAIQCTTWGEQRRMINEDESQMVLHLARDCSSSIMGLGDGRSIISEDTQGLSLAFDFDPVVMSSRVYQSAHRSHLKQAIRASRPRNETPDGPTSPTARMRHMLDSARGLVRDGTNRNTVEPAPEPKGALPQRSEAPVSRPTTERIVSKMLDEAARPVLPARPKGLQRWSMPETSSNSNELKTVQSEARRSIASLAESSIDGDRIVPFGLLEAITQSAAAQPPPDSPTISVLSSIRDLFDDFDLDAPSIITKDSSWFAEDREEYNVVLLGPSQSGKSTLSKAMKFHLEGQSTEDDLSLVTETIFTNLIHGTRIVLEAMETFRESFDDKRLQALAQTIPAQANWQRNMPNQVAETIRQLWADGGFQRTWARRDDYRLGENVKFFADNVDRLAAPNYEPSIQDILHSRRPSTGVTESMIMAPDANVRVFDVGCAFDDCAAWVDAHQKAGEGVTIILTFDITAWFRPPRRGESVAVKGLEKRAQFVLVEQLRLFREMAHLASQHSSLLLVFTKCDRLVLEPFQWDPPPVQWDPETILHALAGSLVDEMETLFRNSIQDEKNRRGLRIIYADLVHDGRKEAIQEILPYILQAKKEPDPLLSDNGSGHESGSREYAHMDLQDLSNLQAPNLTSCSDCTREAASTTTSMIMPGLA